jgi:hypothetical protein
LVLVDVLVDVFVEVDVLGAVFVSEPQPDSTIASAAIAAVPVRAVRFIVNSCQFEMP